LKPLWYWWHFYTEKKIQVSNDLLESGESAFGTDKVIQTAPRMDESPNSLYFSKNHKNLIAFVNNALYSDVQFVLPQSKDNEVETILYAHRVVLAANCPYFEAMFAGGLREAGESIISIHHVSHDIFYQVLVFLYGGQVDFTPKNCIELLRVADEYGLEDLKILCELYIHSGVEMENVDTIEQAANIYNATRLARYCKEFKEVLPEPSLVVEKMGDIVD